MSNLSARQEQVLKEIREQADCQGEAFISKYNKWNSRTLRALADKGHVFFHEGATVCLADHPVQIEAKAFADKQLAKFK